MGANGEIINYREQENVDVVSLPEFMTEEWIGYRVSGSANSPLLSEGDILFVSAHATVEPDALVNKLCIVTTKDGRRWVRTLLRGARASLFTLLAINGPLMADVEIATATPIKHISKA